MSSLEFTLASRRGTAMLIAAVLLLAYFSYIVFGNYSYSNMQRVGNFTIPTW